MVTVTRLEREQKKGQSGRVLWFTGLSGAGKSTLSVQVERQLFQYGYHTILLDGDQIRSGLCSDLGFSAQDRHENLRRVGHVTQLFINAGEIVLAAFISPLLADRKMIRTLFAADEFVEIYCQCPLTICQQRDVKGLYRQVEAGKLTAFTGIQSPYEPPTDADLVIPTAELSIDESVARIMSYLITNNLIIAKNSK